MLVVAIKAKTIAKTNIDPEIAIGAGFSAHDGKKPQEKVFLGYELSKIRALVACFQLESGFISFNPFKL